MIFFISTTGQFLVLPSRDASNICSGLTGPGLGSWKTPPAKNLQKKELGKLAFLGKTNVFCAVISDQEASPWCRFQLVPWSVFFWKLPPNLDAIFVTRIFDCKTSLYLCKRTQWDKKPSVVNTTWTWGCGQKKVTFFKESGVVKGGEHLTCTHSANGPWKKKFELYFPYWICNPKKFKV